MDKDLLPRLMDRASVVQAFPLVCNIVPQVTLNLWVRFAREHLASGWRALPKGLMTIRNPDGYILGLFAFEVKYDLKNGRALWVDSVIIPNLPARGLVWRAVGDTIDNLARTNRCGMVYVGLIEELTAGNENHDWVRSSLEASGYSLASMQAIKRLNVESGAGGVRPA